MITCGTQIADQGLSCSAVGRLRLQLTVIDVTEKNPGQWLVKSRATLEIEGVEKPAYIAETLALYFV